MGSEMCIRDSRDSGQLFRAGMVLHAQIRGYLVHPERGPLVRELGVRHDGRRQSGNGDDGALRTRPLRATERAKKRNRPISTDEVLKK